METPLKRLSTQDILSLEICGSQYGDPYIIIANRIYSVRMLRIIHNSKKHSIICRVYSILLQLSFNVY